MSRLAFLFPGQGSQTVGMGKDFYESSALAREMFDRADACLGFSLSRLCMEGPEETLRLTQNTQPALLTVSTIAFRLLDRRPLMAAGHSLGEYSALVASGSLSFEDAVLLVHKRGQYMQEAVPVGIGAMAAILGSSYDHIRESLKHVKDGIVEVANWNSQEQIVIAGHVQAVKEALSLIDPPRSVMLPVSAPFHCRLMADAERKLAYDLKHTEFRDLQFPVVTNVDARPLLKANEAREALIKQVTRTVLWCDSMEQMKKERIEIFVELGSGKVLSGLIKRIGRQWERSPAVLNVEDMASLERTLNELSS